jgi:palmitoyltransferase
MVSSYVLALMLLCTLTNFVKFHVKLVLDNFTTIENLEREEGQKSKFNIGERRNWEQVFGANQWLWWFPFHTPTSRPIGDGVRWRVHYTKMIDEDEELPADEDSMSQTRGLLQSQSSTAR